MHFSLIFCCGGFLVSVSPAQRDEALRVEVQYWVAVRGALCLSSPLSKPLQRRYTVYISNRDMNPGCVGASRVPADDVGAHLEEDTDQVWPVFWVANPKTSRKVFSF